MARPKLKLTLSSFDIIMELIGASLIILLIAYPIYHYASLPEVIPMHFDAEGIPDGFGQKSWIWTMPVLGLAVYIGLFILNRYPHIFNYPTEITTENAERQYKLATTLIRMVNLSVAMIFFYITYQSVLSSLSGQGGLGTIFIPIVIFSTTAPLIWYLIKASRND